MLRAGFSESTKGHHANRRAASFDKDTGRTPCLALIDCRGVSPGPTSRGLLCLPCRIDCPAAGRRHPEEQHSDERRRAGPASLCSGPRLTLSEQRPSREGRPLLGSPPGSPPPGRYRFRSTGLISFSRRVPAGGDWFVKSQIKRDQTSSVYSFVHSTNTQEGWVLSPVGAFNP